jgi:hypothetical protein
MDQRRVTWMRSRQRIAVTATKEALAITSRWRKTYPITPARTPMADANEQVRAFVLIKGVSAAAGRSSKTPEGLYRV